MAKEKKPGVVITGVHLMTDGNDILVGVEVNGRWVEIIREHRYGNISHISEPLWIQKRAKSAGLRVRLVGGGE